MGYLPTKKFIAPVSAVLVIIFAGWFIEKFIWTQNSGDVFGLSGVDSEKKIAALEIALNKASLDSDSDGLKDWEEALWKTDSQNRDTDGDGISDGEEITSGNDPTVSRLVSDDVFKKPEEFVSGAGTSTKKTISQKAADEFALSYFTAKSRLSGGALGNSAKQKLVLNLLLAMQKGASAYKNKYIQKDIRISKTSGAKEYLNELGGALDENFKEIGESEIELLNKMADTMNFTGLDKLEPYMSAYRETIKFLEKQTVPESYAVLHLALLNSMNNTLIAVEGFRNSQNDPVRGFIGLQMYYKEIYDSRQYLTALKAQTEADEIAFGDGEGGAFFNQYFSKIK